MSVRSSALKGSVLVGVLVVAGLITATTLRHPSTSVHTVPAAGHTGTSLPAPGHPDPRAVRATPGAPRAGDATCHGLDPVLAASRPATSGLQSGASINPTSPTDFAGCAFESSVLDLKRLGANEVTLVVPYVQDNDLTSVIEAGPTTPTPAALTAGITFIRSVHMRVTLSLHDDLTNGSWRAFIDATDRVTWYANYGALLDSLGRIGQQTGVAEISIGDELYGMVSTKANPGNGPAWLRMISGLRKVYTGQLTYGGQRPGGYDDDTDSLSFWPEMSQIGIDAYYPLGTTCDPSVASMETDWSRIDAEYLAPLAKKYHKPILFTEVGYSSIQCDNLNPTYFGHGGYYPGNGSYDGVGQANLFQALFASFVDDADWAGCTVWFWYGDPSDSYRGNLSFSPAAKPAAQIIATWFPRLDQR